MIEQRYKIRNYLKGDEEEIARLFNETYADYVGYVLRTGKYWVWCCLERPDVEKDGVIILEDKNSKEIVAYEVIGKSGNIWELCVKSLPEKREILQLLLEKAINYAEKHNVETITVNIPLEDKISREVCEKLGFAEFSTTSLQLGALDFSQLIKALTERSIDKLQDFDEAIMFFFIERLPWMPEKFLLKISNGTVQVIDCRKASYDIKITTKPRLLMCILFGLQSPVKATIFKRLKVTPFWKIPKAIKFLSTIAVNDLWYYPRADFG